MGLGGYRGAKTGRREHQKTVQSLFSTSPTRQPPARRWSAFANYGQQREDDQEDATVRGSHDIRQHRHDHEMHSFPFIIADNTFASNGGIVIISDL
jgi:hypothetical protein